MEEQRDKGKEIVDMLVDEEAEEVETEETEETTPQEKFRINSGCLFLTYSKCPLPKDYVLEVLRQRLPILKYIVAQENHKDGSLHLHLYLKLEKKIDRNDPRFLDIDGYHPNIRSCRSPKAVQSYCTKDGNYITNMDFYLGSPFRDATDKARQGDFKGAMELLDTLKPRDMAIYGARIRTHLLEQRRQYAKRKSYYTMDDYDQLPEWDRNKSLVLRGLTGSGKTQLAKLLIGNKYHLVRHLDATKNFNEGLHDGIIFDDMSFLHIPREAQIHLVDTYDDSEIHARHSCGFLPAGTPRIFTTNKYLEQILLLDDAIVRRIVVWRVEKVVNKLPGDGQKISVVEEEYHGSGTIDTNTQLLPAVGTNRVRDYAWN